MNTSQAIHFRGTDDHAFERWSIFAEDFLRNVGVSEIDREAMESHFPTGERLFEAAVHRDWLEQVFCAFDDDIALRLENRASEFAFDDHLKLFGPTSHNVAALVILNLTNNLAVELGLMPEPTKSWSALSDTERARFAAAELSPTIRAIRVRNELTRLAVRVREERLKFLQLDDGPKYTEEARHAGQWRKILRGLNRGEEFKEQTFRNKTKPKNGNPPEIGVRRIGGRRSAMHVLLANLPEGLETFEAREKMLKPW